MSKMMTARQEAYLVDLMLPKHDNNEADARIAIALSFGLYKSDAYKLAKKVTMSEASAMIGKLVEEAA